MIKIIRTNSDYQDFIDLVRHLDADLAERDGNDHSFYAQFNKIDKIKYVIVAYENNKPMGCGAIKEYAPNIMEIKRMYTLPVGRGRGIATKVLTELEIWATELSYEKCILETGKTNQKQSGFTKRMDINSFPTTGSMLKSKIVCVSKKISNNADAQY